MYKGPIPVTSRHNPMTSGPNPMTSRPIPVTYRRDGGSTLRAPPTPTPVIHRSEVVGTAPAGQADNITVRGGKGFDRVLSMDRPGGSKEGGGRSFRVSDRTSLPRQEVVILGSCSTRVKLYSIL